MDRVETSSRSLRQLKASRGTSVDAMETLGCSRPPAWWRRLQGPVGGEGVVVVVVQQKRRNL